ncbi:MAG: ParB/RepB/Spo0J family partition protein [Pseudomonadota bacterium]
MNKKGFHSIGLASKSSVAPDQGDVAVVGSVLPMVDPDAQARVTTQNTLSAKPDTSAFLVYIDQIDEQAQPRVTFDETSIAELAKDMVVNGQLDPVVVERRGSNRYALLSGARRYRAARLAGIDVLRATLREINADNVAVARLITQLSANDQRENFTVFERAKAYQELMVLGNFNERELARRISKTPIHVNRIVSVLSAQPAVQEALANGQVSWRRWVNEKQAVIDEFNLMGASIVEDNAVKVGAPAVAVPKVSRKATRHETIALPVDTLRALLADLAIFAQGQGKVVEVAANADKQALIRAVKDYMKGRA